MVRETSLVAVCESVQDRRFLTTLVALTTLLPCPKKKSNWALAPWCSAVWQGRHEQAAVEVGGGGGVSNIPACFGSWID